MTSETSEKKDYSALPSYGMYDIVPIEASVEKLLKYDYLIFLGWNSMTDENMDKLYEYVKNGGNLLMSAAHLNYSTKRSGEFIMTDAERLEKLFGARFTGEFFKSNNGVKFNYDSLSPKISYPGKPMLYPLYRALVREILTRSHELYPNLRVLSSDRLRYAVYAGNKIYLLNTDYDLPITVKIVYGDADSRVREVTLEPLELKTVKI